MAIKSVQKVIKIGDSLGVTIPAKDARRLNVKKGDEIHVSYDKPKVDSQTIEVVAVTQDLIKRHKKALKNLSQR